MGASCAVSVFEPLCEATLVLEGLGDTRQTWRGAISFGRRPTECLFRVTVMEHA